MAIRFAVGNAVSFSYSNLLPQMVSLTLYFSSFKGSQTIFAYVFFFTSFYKSISLLLCCAHILVSHLIGVPVHFLLSVSRLLHLVLRVGHWGLASFQLWWKYVVLPISGLNFAALIHCCWSWGTVILELSVLGFELFYVRTPLILSIQSVEALIVPVW